MFFLYGASPDMSKEMQHALDTEIDKYGDIIKADGFIDSYNNITLKAMHTLKFFLNKGNFLPCALKNVLRPNIRHKIPFIGIQFFSHFQICLHHHLLNIFSRQTMMYL